MNLSNEFRLIAACCRWPRSPARDAIVATIAAEVDWGLVARIAERHRVEGLVWNALRQGNVEMPDDARERFRMHAIKIARQNLVLASESLRLSKRFTDAGIDHVFVKGISLSALLYGGIGAKKGWDIDLLIALPEVEAAAALLQRDGYDLCVPSGPLARARLGRWHEHWKESVWKVSGKRIYVELHTRLADNPMLVPAIGVRSDIQWVDVSNGRSLPTLATDELFAYLCVHGASSAWFRLKWIADVGALVGGCEPEEIARLYRRSQELGAGRSAAQALLLCQRLFDILLPAQLATELAASPVNRWLVAIALRKLAGRAVATELRRTRLGTLTIHLMQLGLMPGLRFKLAELGRQLVHPADRVAVPLPPALRFLYPLVSIRRRLTNRRARRTEN